MTKDIPLAVDSIDIKIIKELLDNPNTKGSTLAKKFGIPLSTVQRRRSLLERSVLTRKYELNTRELGWRNAEILMMVENGKADQIAQELMEKFDNVTSASMRINSGGNVAASISYQTSDELHDLMEQIRRMPDITNIQWTEIVRETSDENRRIANLIFNSSHQK